MAADASLAGAPRRTEPLLPRAVLALVVLALTARGVAAVLLPMAGDEPDDLQILNGDVLGFWHFFDDPEMYGLDQSRLPHIVSLPLAALLGLKALLALRLLFLLAHAGALYFLWRIGKTLFTSPWAASLPVLFGALGSYWSSASPFALTAGDNLYLLFFMMALDHTLRALPRWRESGDADGYMRWVLFLGLAMASKLFTLFFLAALAAGHALLLRRIQRTTVTLPRRFRSVLALFLGAVLALNLIPAPPAAKTVASLVMVAVYLAWWFRSRRAETRSLGFFGFWCWTGLVVFALTLCFSPVYLNLRNVLKTTSWFSTYNTGLIVANHHYYDMLVVLVLKTGFVSLALATAAGCLLLFRRARWDARHGLLVLLFSIHFLAISSARHHTTWYPLAIQPLLVFPLAAVADRILTSGKGPRRAAWAALLLFAVLIENQWHYWRWFPYGHFDGAQYGRENIGWNRAGFVTFEVFPKLVDHFASARLPAGTAVGIKLVEVDRYNEWASYLLDMDLRARIGEHGYRFFEPGSLDDPALAWLLTGPLYHPEADRAAQDSGRYRMVRSFAVAGIEVVRLYQRAAADTAPSPAQ